MVMVESQIKKSNGKFKLNFDLALGIPYYAVLFIFVIVPLLIMVLYAFTTNTTSILNIQFTLANFEKFFSKIEFIMKLGESLWIAILSTIVCLLICYPVAYMVSRLRPRVQTILVLLITATMWINSLVLAYALRSVFILAGAWLFGENRILLATDMSLVVGIVFIYLPYMFLPIYTQMTKIDPSLLESAADLGANKFQTIFKVVVPLTLSSVISGSMIVLLPATTTLVVSQYLGDGRRPQIGDLINAKMNSLRTYGEGAAYALILALVLLLFVFIFKKLDKYEGVLANEK
jgi:spermidine/putrescine transport system permease protein